MKTLLSFVLPTCYPDLFRSRFYTCLPVFAPFSKYICFCINFQPPFTLEEVAEEVSFLRNSGFRVEYTYNDYKFTPDTLSYVRLRNDAARLAPKDTLYFVDFDDDILYFSEDYDIASRVWASVILFLLENPSCGSFRIDTRCYAYPRITFNRLYSVFYPRGGTGLGLIYKNIYGGQILPEYLLDLVGGCEDLLQTRQRVLDGYLAGFVISPFGEHTDIKLEETRIYHIREQNRNLRKGTVRNYLSKIDPSLLSFDCYSGDYDPSWEDSAIDIDPFKSVEEIVSEIEKLL